MPIRAAVSSVTLLFTWHGRLIYSHCVVHSCSMIRVCLGTSLTTHKSKTQLLYITLYFVVQQTGT